MSTRASVQELLIRICLVAVVVCLWAELLPSSGNGKKLPNKDSIPYCQGTYKQNHKNCGQFGFGGNADSSKVRRITTNYTSSCNSDNLDVTLDPEIIHKIELITNVFENGDLTMGYGYVTDLHDGRGFTSGYLGFCTGTGDAYACVKEYVNRKRQNNILQKYLPALKRLADAGSSSTSAIKQYYFDWTRAACSDPIFVQTQIDVGRSLNLQPSINYARRAGVTSNLGISIFYDTVVEQGIDCDTSYGSISIDRLLNLVGSRGAKQSEQDYLSKFLVSRRKMLCCFPDNVWPPSADRVSDLQHLVNNWDYNQDLSNPVNLIAYTQTVKGNEQTVYDTDHCYSQANPNQTKVPHGWVLPSPQVLPIPKLC